MLAFRIPNDPLCHNGSVPRPTMFLFLIVFCIFLNSEAQAWNPDYAYGLPRQRRMCVQRQAGNQVHLTSILPDEDCPVAATRYIVIFGKEPRGSIALMPTTTDLKFYPPLVLVWPAQEDTTQTHLWHFTCVKPHEVMILNSKISLMKYKGEITATADKTECLDVEKRALKYCQDKFEGEELLESCPLGWGVQ